MLGSGIYVLNTALGAGILSLIRKEVIDQLLCARHYIKWKRLEPRLDDSLGLLLRFLNSKPLLLNGSPKL